MNLSKTVLLLLGSLRDFDIDGETAAALALRGRGLKRTYPRTTSRPAVTIDALPEKWHGVLLGNKVGWPRQGVVWEETATFFSLSLSVFTFFTRLGYLGIAFS